MIGMLKARTCVIGHILTEVDNEMLFLTHDTCMWIMSSKVVLPLFQNSSSKIGEDYFKRTMEVVKSFTPDFKSAMSMVDINIHGLSQNANDKVAYYAAGQIVLQEWKTTKVPV